LFVVKERRVQECMRLRDGPILKREKSVGGERRKRQQKKDADMSG
jgi:hypothetical protein